MKACKNSKRYKGLRRPRCNGGRPCKACRVKFNEQNLNTKEKNVRVPAVG